MTSKLVSKLEADLGVQLIKRSTRALAPTEVGQAYYERIKALLDEFDALERGYYSIKALNPTGIVPVGPDLPGLAPVALQSAEPEPQA